MLNNWVNKEIIEQTETFKEKFVSNKPFPHVVIQNFLNEEKFSKLKEAIQQEEFYLEDHDLYQFLRTTDLKNSNNNFIQEFRNFVFSEEFIELFKEISHLPLKYKNGDLHALSLQPTHYLLPHDDQVDSRALAFIIYLQDCKEEDGGTLDLFSSNNNRPSKKQCSYVPKKNQLICFEVSPISFHQISEILQNQRNSVSGWLYK